MPVLWYLFCTVTAECNAVDPRKGGEENVSKRKAVRVVDAACLEPFAQGMMLSAESEGKLYLSIHYHSDLV